MESIYHKKLYDDNHIKLNTILSTMPSFVNDYFQEIENRTTIKTRISYVYDIRIFFSFLITNKLEYQTFLTSDFQLDHLNNIGINDFQHYLDYLKVYCSNDGVTHKNDVQGIRRKLSALRSFYLYLNKHQLLDNNYVALVDLPKLHNDKNIRLNSNEVTELLNLVKHGGDNLNGMKKVYYEKNKLRNIAIFTLLLGSGIRASECVALNITDIDFKNKRIKIVRNSSEADFIYFGNEVDKALSNYITKSRKFIKAEQNHENFLFLSIQRKIMDIKSLENLVSDFTKQITPTKHITPQKLRNTFGSSLYKKTGDIYLVAEVLGHIDPKTIKKYYTDNGDEHIRKEIQKLDILNEKSYIL